MLFPFGIIENIYPRSGKDPVLFNNSRKHKEEQNDLSMGFEKRVFKSLS